MFDSTTTNPHSVLSLWRYPVKSMLGEELTQAVVTERGLSGDRVYALIDQATGKVASAKHPRKWGGLLACRASQLAGGKVQITLPDGTIITSDQRDCDALLAAEFNCDAKLSMNRPANPSVEDVDPFAETETITDSGVFMLRDGFADYAPIHLLTTATLACFHELYPEGRFEVPRFRPNLVVKTEADGFVENDWVGRTLVIGDEVRLRISDPAPRCIMTTLPQGDLNHDLGILRIANQHNRVSVPALGGRRLACVGVYGFVLSGGMIRCEDAVCVE